MKRKSKLTIACSALLLAAVVVGGTFAYFYDSMTVTNEFTTAGNDDPSKGVDIEVTEPGFDEEEAKDVLPGDVIAKDPTVKNNKGDAYVRFVVRLVDKESQEVITDQARANKILSMIVYNESLDDTEKYDSTAVDGMPSMNTTQFTLDSTRSEVGEYYYNYNGVFSNGATAVLFTHVIVPTDWNQTDIATLGNFDIVVVGQAIQADNMADADEAFKALDGELAGN